MPSLQELLDTLKYNRFVGQQPFGHYDHDAACMIGPPAVGEQQEECAPQCAPVSEEFAAQASSGSAEGVSYEQCTEPRTGEVLYRFVR